MSRGRGHDRRADRGLVHAEPSELGAVERAKAGMPVTIASIFDS
jgi:hypothetical protein